MDILSWVIFGALAGTVANIVDPAPAKGGLLGAVILGILGAILGGFLASIVFGVTVAGFNLQSFAIAVLGSILLLFFGRAWRKV